MHCHLLCRKAGETEETYHIQEGLGHLHFPLCGCTVEWSTLNLIPHIHMLWMTLDHTLNCPAWLCRCTQKGIYVHTVLSVLHISDIWFSFIVWLLQTWVKTAMLFSFNFAPKFLYIHASGYLPMWKFCSSTYGIQRTTNILQKRKEERELWTYGKKLTLTARCRGVAMLKLMREGSAPASSRAHRVWYLLPWTAQCRAVSPSLSYTVGAIVPDRHST